MNLRQIEVFRAVMITGSISGAAKLLFVSQPAISRLLSQTESRLGFQLFERYRGRLHATPEAKQLFDAVGELYEGVQRVNALAKDLAQNRQGILNVVSATSIGQMIIPQAIALFRKASPGVKVNFLILHYSHLQARLLERKADVGLITSPMQHPNLVVTPLCANRLVFICPAKHPLARLETIALADLRPYPLIAYDVGTPHGVMVDRLYSEAGEPLNAVIEVGSPQSACALVQMGAGVALVDEFSVRSWLGQTDRLAVRPLVSTPSMPASLVYSAAEPPSQLAHAFIEVLRKLILEHGIGGSGQDVVPPFSPRDLEAHNIMLRAPYKM